MSHTYSNCTIIQVVSIAVIKNVKIWQFLFDDILQWAMISVPLKLVTRVFYQWFTSTNTELVLSLRASHVGAKVVYGQWTVSSRLLRRYLTVSQCDGPPVTSITSTDKHTENTPRIRSASLQFILQPTRSHLLNKVFLTFSQLNFFALIKTKHRKCISTRRYL